MIVIHGIALADQFNLWAESSQFISSKNTKKHAHPFALPNNELYDILLTLTDSKLVRGSNTNTITLLLPSTSSQPMPSPNLVLVAPVYETKASVLSPWNIPAISLDPKPGQELLISLPTNPPHGIVYGSSLIFWTEVAKFTFELISRQCFIPELERTANHEGLKEKKEILQARWSVYLSNEDMKRLTELIRMMPPICRSVMHAEKSQEPHELVYEFINQVIDGFVREVSATSSLSSKLGAKSTVPEEQWLRGLTSLDSTFEIEQEKVNTFSGQLNSWLGQIQPVDSDSAFRTCFRVECPETMKSENGEWRITYHLQATDDRSLLVSANEIWKLGTSEMRFMKRRFENPQERLLADLGKASTVFPLIEDSLKDSHPVALKLNTDEVYGFLRETAPLLEQSGFGILFPSWWQKTSARLGVKLKLRPRNSSRIGSGLLGTDGIVEYDWMIAVGDQTFAPEEFNKLAKMKVPLVNIRGQWVEIKSEEIEKALRFFQKVHSNNELNLGEALHLALDQENLDTGLPILDVETEGWITELMNGLSDNVKIAQIHAPNTFQGQLRPYQVKGLSWLEFLRQFGFGACLADDMGLGKTIQLIALLLQERSISSSSQQTLLICPMSIVGNWYRELHRFGPSLKVLVHHGSGRLAGEKFIEEVKNYDVIITTYSLAARDIDNLSRIEWHRIVLDEAQNIKNPDTKQTLAIKKLKSGYRVAMTGTPVENRLSELWSIMDFLNPGYLGTLSEFKRNFIIPVEKFHDQETAVTMKRLIQPFVLRRLKTDPKIIQDLPEKMEMKVLCNLTREQATLYEAVVKDMLEKIENSEGIERKGLVLSTLTKLKQVCNHPAQFLHDHSNFAGRSGKAARLEEMLEEALAEGDKALIFTQFREMGVMIHKYLQDKFETEILFMHGGTPKKQRDAMVQKFQEDGQGPKIFILSLKVGGVGLNLTAANRVFHFDRWWNPAVENQATDRAFRIGQKRNVQVHKFVAVGTLEERIDQMIEQKKELAERIIGTGEAWLTEMSTSQLKELFKLSKDTIGEE